MITHTKQPQKGEQKDSKSKKSQKKWVKINHFCKLESKLSQNTNQEQATIFNQKKNQKIKKFTLKSLPIKCEKS